LSGHIVDFAVAVVIFAVADFGIGRWCVAGLPFPTEADLFALVASPAAGTGKVVDFSVAVVVFVVAVFGFGGHLSVAIAPPFAIGFADLGSLFAGAFACRTREATITFSFFVGVAGAAVFSFVDVTVAVVVFAVSANLFDRLGSATGLPGSSDTDLFAWSAFGLAGAAEVVVDQSVAIVVFVVALFGLGFFLIVTGRAPVAIDADLNAVFAFSLVAGLGRSGIAGFFLVVFGAGAAFIHLAITVIVEGIAFFFLGENLSLALGPDAAKTTLCPRGTDPLS